MANPILVTGAAERVGGVGRTITEQLLKQGKAVRAMVRNEDERAQALRDMGSQHDNPAYEGDVLARRALKAGATGYLLKEMIRTELLEAIRAVHLGRKYIPQKIAVKLVDHYAEDDLSEREIEVLREAARGTSNKIIASHLSISEATVKAHMKNILLKLGASESNACREHCNDPRLSHVARFS